MKLYISNELGCAYRRNGDELECAPLMADGTLDTDDFASVEPELVGEEPVTFQGVETNLYGVYATLEKVLA